MAIQHIVVVESGWVFVGEVTERTNEFIINDAYTIRKWGTTRGLGELAINGVTKDTVLDPCFQIIVHKAKVMFTIPCKVKLGV